MHHINFNLFIECIVSNCTDTLMLIMRWVLTTHMALLNKHSLEFNEFGENYSPFICVRIPQGYGHVFV